MKFKVLSEVTVRGLGKMKHEHVQEFSDNGNVFQRAVQYREYMRSIFPECDFTLLKAEEVTS